MAPELGVTLIEQEVGESEERWGEKRERGERGEEREERGGVVEEEVWEEKRSEDGEGGGDQGFESIHIISYLSVYYVFFLSSSMLKGLFH